MFRTHAAFKALVPAFALGLLSCVADPSLMGEVDVMEDEAALVVPNPGLYGTFRISTVEPGQLTLLVLKTDGTYHTGKAIACFTTPCNPVQEDGRYLLGVSSDARKYLYLYSESGDREVYEYALGGDTLRVRAKGTAWVSMSRTVDASWCEEPLDCKLQGLPVGPCAGSWYCGWNICSYACWPPPETE